MTFRRTIAFAILCACSGSSVMAQESVSPQNTPSAQESVLLPSRAIALPPLVPPDGLSPGERLIAIERWASDYQKWQAWRAQWRNRPEPGWFSNKERREPPTPPEWLAESCVSVADDDDWLTEGCRAWREWTQNDESVDQMAQQVAQTRANQEAPRRTIWWERIHLDALWPMTQSGTSAFGVAGTHATFNVTKRFQVFMAPGLILMRLPVLGEQTWSVATDWGFSFRMADFRMPGLQRPSTVHFNIARVWILGTGGQPVPGELYLAGLSLTFKQR